MLTALKAEFAGGNKYRIITKTGPDVEKLAELGWIVYSDPAALLADMESGKKMLNMRFEKRNKIMDYLRKQIPALAA